MLLESIKLKYEKKVEALRQMRIDAIRDLEVSTKNKIERDLRIYEDVLKDVNNVLNPPKIDVDALFDKICTLVSLEFNVGRSYLGSKLRYKEIVEARYIAMYLIRKHTNLGVVEIGKRFNRDHSTVVYACDSVESDLELYDDLRGQVNRIESLILK